MIQRIPLLLFLAVILLLISGGIARSQESRSPFAIRGTLPWHNFLSGPSSWNEEDYRQYLDEMQAYGFNLVVFHNYTGGAQRYHTYVEPMIRVTARDVLPEATFGTSLTPWWGYRPLHLSEFAYGTNRLYDMLPGADAFGSSSMLTARNNEERYQNAQSLMRRVMEMAHERGIQFAIGFEFGVHPPEFASILPREAILEDNGVVLKPDSPAAALLVRNIVDDILTAYPGIDQIWLWYQEHSFFVETDQPWAEAYIRLAYDYIKQKAPEVTVVLSGWGGSGQLPDLLLYLDQQLPKDIVFAPLNPWQGEQPHVSALALIAHHRTVWAIPWLEGDARLWHLQPRVNTLFENVRKTYEDSLDGVIALHWRTEDIRINFDAYARAIEDPTRIPTVEQFYASWSRDQYGEEAAIELAPLLAKMDTEALLNGTDSPEYYPYDPFTWGLLKEDTRKNIETLLPLVSRLVQQADKPEHRVNLSWLDSNLKFFLQLEQVSLGMQRAYRLQEDWLAGRIKNADLKQQALLAREELKRAPIQDLFETYSQRVRSRGELGVLSSLNQRVWLQYRELDQFLNQISEEFLNK